MAVTAVGCAIGDEDFDIELMASLRSIAMAVKLAICDFWQVQCYCDLLSRDPKAVAVKLRAYAEKLP